MDLQPAARNDPSDAPAPCANCGASVDDAFCGHCGQRRFRSEDRRLAHLLRAFAEAITNLDGRFWRSLFALMFRPGLLSRDYIEGRRARWMSPVSLFLLANVLYFFAPGMSDFDLPLRDHVSGAVRVQYDPALANLPTDRRAQLAEGGGQMHSRFTDAWVIARLEAEAARQRAGTTASSPLPAFEQLAKEYAITSANVSKALIVLHVPFLALLLMLAMAGSGHYFAEHMVVALHFFAAMLLTFELLVLPGASITAALGVPGVPDFMRVIVGGVIAIYATLAVRRAYGCGWVRAVIAGHVLLFGLLAINISIYRAVQFALVMALT